MHDTETTTAGAGADADAGAGESCAVCLDDPIELARVAILSGCLHRFCRDCVLAWSRRSRNCPLCKRAFVSFIHSVKGDDDYAETRLPPLEPLPPPPPPPAPPVGQQPDD